MNLNHYLCSTEELYLVHKISSLNFVGFDLGLGSTPLRQYLYFVGPEGEIRLGYDPIHSDIGLFAFAAIIEFPPKISNFMPPFGFYPPSGKRNGRVVVKL